MLVWPSPGPLWSVVVRWLVLSVLFVAVISFDVNVQAAAVDAVGDGSIDAFLMILLLDRLLVVGEFVWLGQEQRPERVSHRGPHSSVLVEAEREVGRAAVVTDP